MTIRNGTDVKAIREARAITQDNLATMAGVSIRSVRRAEGGESVSGETLRCLAAALDEHFEPAIEESGVDRRLQWLSKPSRPFEWAVTAFLSTLALSLPFVLATMFSYPAFYDAVRSFSPLALIPVMVAQTIGVALLLAWAAYDHASKRRAPTRAAANGVLLAGCWVSFLAFMGFGFYFGSILAEIEGTPGKSWTLFREAYLHPFAVIGILVMVYGTVRTIPRTERWYLTTMDRFLYGSNRTVP